MRGKLPKTHPFSFATQRSGSAWYAVDECCLDEFVALISRTTHPLDCAAAERIEQNVPLYDGDQLRAQLVAGEAQDDLLSEWANVLLTGPGAFVLKKAYADVAPVDRATAIFEELIGQQQGNGSAGSDHFAKPGANDRIWNALEKLCLRDPRTFALYYANEFIALAAEAWLGPGYQVTSQVNVVNPGGAAQQPHRDYHLGFQAIEQVARYPAHVHQFSPLLTLQGVVAHCDMSVESGPTRLLPFSQTYGAGYLAVQRPDFREAFEARCVQIPMEKGDVVFLSPALMHAAGANRTRNVSRMANLLQISSAYGRAMESVNRTRMCLSLYPALQQLCEEGTLSRNARDRAIAACAEGYSFPTDLDRHPPIGGLAPRSQQSLMIEACEQRWKPRELEEELGAS